MGSRSHTTGQGFQPGLIGKRTIAAVLASERQAGADNRYALYVAPLGNGEHLVRNPCNETPYKVGSTLGGQTFKAGQVVFLGSNAGTPGEVIIGLPPPGRGGGSEFAIAGQVRRQRFNVAPLCPLPPTGHSYLAILDDGSNFRAWLYADGEHQETLGTGSLPLSFALTSSLQRAPVSGQLVTYMGVPSSPTMRFCTLDCEAGDSTSYSVSAPGMISSAAVVSDGSWIYFRAASSISNWQHSAQLYRVPILTDGTVSGSFGAVMPALEYGAPFAFDAALSLNSSLLDLGAGDFAILGTYGGSPAALLYQSGVWAVELRELVGMSNSPGYPVGGSGSAVHRGDTGGLYSGRPVVFEPGGEREIIPEVDHAAYEPVIGEYLAPSPSGSDVVLYTEAAGILRLPVAEPLAPLLATCGPAVVTVNLAPGGYRPSHVFPLD